MMLGNGRVLGSSLAAGLIRAAAALALVVSGLGCRSFDPMKTQPLTGDNPRAFTRQLVRAHQANDILRIPDLEEEDRDEAVGVARRAAAMLLPELRKASSSETWGGLTNGGVVVGRYLLRADPTEGQWQPGLFDEFQKTDGVRLPRKQSRWVREGLGAPLVGIRHPVREITNALTHYPKKGLFLPVTATLDFADEPNADGLVEAWVHLNDPRHRAHRELAADFTLPNEKLLGGGGWEKLALSWLFRPEAPLKESSVFLTEPYDPNKVVVVFVHGLDSAPNIWRHAISMLQADPEVGPRCQFWYFHYPTGLMVTGSAKIMREKLRAIRQRYDPEGDDPGFNQMMLVGHSMGGLVSRMQVVDSKDALWNSYFRKPIDQMKLGEGTRKTLTRSLVFDRQPYVTRAMFVASPHRGSEVANWNIARWLTGLVRLPSRTAAAAKDLMTQNYDALNPEVLKFKSLGATSVEMLSPSHPYFKALEVLPIPVPHHSVIGDRGKGDGEKGSDGVVPYWSSHLQTAESEKIVPEGHSCTSHPETLSEIRRVVRLHLGLPEVNP